MKNLKTYSIILISLFTIPILAKSSASLTLEYPDKECSLKDTGINNMFDHIKSLSGDWEGTFEWSGARSSKGKMDARYYLTGNGSAVVEDLLMDGKPMMTSVYHLDGGVIRMTHYCAAGNQPRLKMSKIDEEQNSIYFEFVDATNMKTPEDAHVHGFKLQFRDKDHIILIFNFRRADIQSNEQVQLSRTMHS